MCSFSFCGRSFFTLFTGIVDNVEWKQCCDCNAVRTMMFVIDGFINWFSYQLQTTSCIRLSYIGSCQWLYAVCSFAMTLFGSRFSFGSFCFFTLFIGIIDNVKWKQCCECNAICIMMFVIDGFRNWCLISYKHCCACVSVTSVVASVYIHTVDS